MREFIRTRFACDFCNKKGGSRHHMAKHEKGCTSNPDRVCGVCKFKFDADMVNHGDGEQKDMGELLVALSRDRGEALKISDFPYGEVKLKHLLEAADDCPNCILAAIKISGYDDMWFDYNYKEKISVFWGDYNEINRDSGECW